MAKYAQITHVCHPPTSWGGVGDQFTYKLSCKDLQEMSRYAQKSYVCQPHPFMWVIWSQFTNDFFFCYE